MRYTTEYQPAISQTCKTYIRNSINEVFANDTTAIYGLSYIIEVIEEELSQNDNEEIFGIELKDIEALRKLYAENVDYIEF